MRPTNTTSPEYIRQLEAQLADANYKVMVARTMLSAISRYCQNAGMGADFRDWMLPDQLVTWEGVFSGLTARAALDADIAASQAAGVNDDSEASHD